MEGPSRSRRRRRRGRGRGRGKAAEGAKDQTAEGAKDQTAEGGKDQTYQPRALNIPAVAELVLHFFALPLRAREVSGTPGHFGTGDILSPVPADLVPPYLLSSVIALRSVSAALADAVTSPAARLCGPDYDEIVKVARKKKKSKYLEVWKRAVVVYVEVSRQYPHRPFPMDRIRSALEKGWRITCGFNWFEDCTGTDLDDESEVLEFLRTGTYEGVLLSGCQLAPEVLPDKIKYLELQRTRAFADDEFDFDFRYMKNLRKLGIVSMYMPSRATLLSCKAIPTLIMSNLRGVDEDELDPGLFRAKRQALSLFQIEEEIQWHLLVNARIIVVYFCNNLFTCYDRFTKLWYPELGFDMGFDDDSRRRRKPSAEYITIADCREIGQLYIPGNTKQVRIQWCAYLESVMVFGDQEDLSLVYCRQLEVLHPGDHENRPRIAKLNVHGCDALNWNTIAEYCDVGTISTSASVGFVDALKEKLAKLFPQAQVTVFEDPPIDEDEDELSFEFQPGGVLPDAWRASDYGFDDYGFDPYDDDYD